MTMQRMMGAVAFLFVTPVLAKDDTAERLVKMQERQAEAVAKNAPDCDKIGKALLATVDEDAALMKSVYAADAKKSKEQKRAEKAEFMTRYGKRLKAAQGKIAPLRACKGNAQVRSWKNTLDEATAPPRRGG